MSNEKYKTSLPITHEDVQRGETSQAKILQMVLPRSTVLECGPAYGSMTRYLKEKLDCTVYIVEADTESFTYTVQFADGGVCADLEDDAWMEQLPKGAFDYVMYADVLEHLRNPQEVLKKMRRFLKPNGSALVSVPNVAYGDIVLNLLCDRFTYTQTGLLDNTHIHLFAREDLRAMIRAAGYYLAYETYIRIPLRCSEQGALLAKEEYQKLRPTVMDDPAKEIYQFICQLTQTEVAGRSDIDRLMAAGREGPCRTQVFFDTGDGFHENQSRFFLHPYNQDFEFNIPLEQEICALRVDPADKPVLVTVKKCCAVSGEGIYDLPLETNGVLFGNAYMFDTSDPQLLFPAWEKEIREVRMILNVISITAEAAENCVYQKYQEEEKRQEERDVATRRHEEEIVKLQESSRQELEQERERSGRLLAQLWEESRLALKEEQRCSEQALGQMEERFRLELKEKQEDFAQQIQKMRADVEASLELLSNQKADVERELAACRGDYAAATAQRDGLRYDLAQVQSAYQEISNAFFWKITKPSRVVLDCVKAVFRKNRLMRLIGRGVKCWLENGIAYTLARVRSKFYQGGLRGLARQSAAPETTFLGSLDPQDVQKLYALQIDVIVPVYNGFEYLATLFASMEQTQVPYRLILIDDCSPDPRVRPYLEDYAEEKTNVVLLKNEKNLGFTRSANRGLKYGKNHAALVNTDVVLPPMWLERLMLPIVARENVASSTPFTNSGTICSFPNFCQDNRLFLSLKTEEIDRAFQTITPQYHVIPTGVGFCMGMNRSAIKTIGILDAKSFEKGYGEENDWSRRAAEAGFVNVHVENLFVHHKHGGSFPNEEKQKLIQEHAAILAEKHPDYNRLVANYCAQDPCKSIRETVKEHLLRTYDRAYTVVALNHSWGGGASDYLRHERERLLGEGKRVFYVEYVLETRKFKIILSYQVERREIWTDGSFEALCRALPARIDEIWINELVTYPDVYHMLMELPIFAKKHRARLLYLVHDFFSVCPAINLLNTAETFCDLPELESCDKCLEENPRCGELHREECKAGMAAWRGNWLNCLRQCDEIRTFSDSSKTLMLRAYPELSAERVTVRPHQINYLPPIAQRKKRTETLNIGVVGAIHEQKGRKLTEQLVQLVHEQKLPVKITIIGFTWPPITGTAHTETGAYQRDMLPRLIVENDIDIILIPSIWPETFSYTTQEIIAMGLPVACFNLGAPAERLRKYDKGIVIPRIDAELTLKHLEDYGNRNLVFPSGRQRCVLFIAEQRDYAVRYRVEHFQEELLFLGITSKTVMMSEVNYIDFSRFDAIVVYRCASAAVGNYLRTMADHWRIKLLFDIDDLVFDERSILNSGLPQREKEIYLEKAAGFCAVMQLADGLIASTTVLGEKMKALFPDKPVCVRRNSASLEMETLSVCAAERAMGAYCENVYLAYFSGSWTHDGDFALISKVIERIFQKYPDVKLRIYGCLNIPAALERYQDRIERYEFTGDWRSLPEQIARAHIHLAPLEDSEFNACKSENKWIEAALAARPLVTSNLPELCQIIRHGETGFLCDTDSEWEEALSILIENTEKRIEVGRSAQRTVLETHLTRNTGKEAVSFILSAEGCCE